MILGGWLHLLGAALVVTLVRGLALFLAVYAVTVLVRRLSCDARHLIWLGVVAAFLLIPLCWLLLPPIQVGAWIRSSPATFQRLAAAPMLSAQDYMRLVEQAGMRFSPAECSPPKPPSPAYLALPAVWLAGVLVLAARPVAGLARLRRMAVEVAGCARLQALAGGLARGLRIRRKIAVQLSPHCTIPFTFGIWRPVILLPEGARGWPAQRVRSALIHELAHIRRRDVLSRSAAYAVCLLLWFIPPLWLAYGGLLREAESCCDQQVISRGIRGPAYARQLVDLVQQSRGKLLLPCISSTMGGKGLRQRIRNVLRLAPGRRPFGVRGALRVLPVFLCCLVPVLVLAGRLKPAALGPEEPLFGTWLNEEYDRSDRFLCSKTVISPDSRKLNYRHIGDAEPYADSRGSFEASWAGSGGDRWYKCRWTGWLRASGAGRVEGFVLCRVSGGGKILESVWAQYGYPTELSRLGLGYQVYRRE